MNIYFFNLIQVIECLIQFHQKELMKIHLPRLLFLKYSTLPVIGLMNWREENFYQARQSFYTQKMCLWSFCLKFPPLLVREENFYQARQPFGCTRWSSCKPNWGLFNFQNNSSMFSSLTWINTKKRWFL